ncbi:MAG TPA: transglycosylase SLT domain-containing protein [Gaiellaceae bacterium]|nr:transglycosylase SLT domain-containing protein [Thermoleophilia bacterium]HWJ32547.1 transglycosylase SLT domain-containing protein [Gaiellaceae bacterium]
MVRETQRRLALLAIVGVVAVAWAAAFTSTGVTPIASAAPAPAPPRVTAARVAPCPFPAALRPAFEAAATDAALPPALLWAVAKIESNLRADAESAAGARGLLQLMPATARSLNLKIDEPRSNVLAGARYLRQLLDRFRSSDLALAAYNAGPTAVAAAGGAPSAGVLRYVSNVNLLWTSVAGCR